ncbi:MAG: hypothetical protein ACRDN0_19735 [Trebonia sp.]
MSSETYRVVLSIEIERPAAEVYEFLASPVNHIGLHPSTAGISGGDTGAVHGVGDMWREHIARPTGETAEADWIVTRAVPGERWTFQSVRFGGRPIRLTFDYVFAERDQKTLVTRTMDTVAASYANLTDIERSTFGAPGPHAQILPNLKQRLETG